MSNLLFVQMLDECVPAEQFRHSSTRARVWSRAPPPESVVSEEECSYNERLCCSAIASVQHTDKRLAMDY